LNKVLQLKIAALILFWFGIQAEFFILVGMPISYYRDGTIGGQYPQTIFEVWWRGAIFFMYTFFGHVTHIVSGYWLSKGNKKGIILSLSLCLYEIIPFLVPSESKNLFTWDGIGIRILFAFVIFLIVSGRKELIQLRSENWLPWKNPIQKK